MSGMGGKEELTAQFLLATLHSACYTLPAAIFVVQYPTPVSLCLYMWYLSFINISVNL